MNIPLNIPFYFGRLLLRYKNNPLSGYSFTIELMFYGRGHYRIRKKMRILKKKRKKGLTNSK